MAIRLVLVATAALFVFSKNALASEWWTIETDGCKPTAVTSAGNLDYSSPRGFYLNKKQMQQNPTLRDKMDFVDVWYDEGNNGRVYLRFFRTKNGCESAVKTGSEADEDEQKRLEQYK